MSKCLTPVRTFGPYSAFAAARKAAFEAVDGAYSARGASLTHGLPAPREDLDAAMAAAECFRR